MFKIIISFWHLLDYVLFETKNPYGGDPRITNNPPPFPALCTTSPRTPPSLLIMLNRGALCCQYPLLVCFMRARGQRQTPGWRGRKGGTVALCDARARTATGGRGGVRFEDNNRDKSAFASKGNGKETTNKNGGAEEERGREHKENNDIKEAEECWRALAISLVTDVVGGGGGRGK